MILVPGTPEALRVAGLRCRPWSRWARDLLTVRRVLDCALNDCGCRFGVVAKAKGWQSCSCAPRSGGGGVPAVACRLGHGLFVELCRDHGYLGKRFIPREACGTHFVDVLDVSARPLVDAVARF